MSRDAAALTGLTALTGAAIVNQQVQANGGWGSLMDAASALPGLPGFNPSTLPPLVTTGPIPISDQQQYGPIGGGYGPEQVAQGPTIVWTQIPDDWVVGPQIITSSPNAAESSVWELGPGLRGQAIEQALGQNFPGNFPVIDKFENGLATSIKSLDLGAPSYQDAAALDRTLSGYIDKVVNYNGTGPQGWAGVIIPQSQITGRALDLAIPNAGTAVQQKIINQAVLNGAAKGVTVNVIIYP
jgi:hypothetical protein